MSHAIGKYSLPLIRSFSSFRPVAKEEVHSRVNRLFSSKPDLQRPLSLSSGLRSRCLQTNPLSLTKSLRHIHNTPRFSIKVIDPHQASSECNEEIEIPQEFNHVEMQELVANLISRKNKKALIQLLNAFQDNVQFPQFKDNFWEVIIRDELVKARDLPLIKELFPRFRNEKEIFEDSALFNRPIETGDLDLVKTLIRARMKPFHAQKRGYDILHLSIFRKQHAITRYLLAVSGYDINVSQRFTLFPIRHEDYVTLVYLAVATNDPECLQMLIRMGADVNRSNRSPQRVSSFLPMTDPDTPLICAASRGYEECFFILLQQKIIDLDFRGHYGQTALLQACINKQTAIAKALIAKKADVNIPDYVGITPLDAAEATYNEPLKEALLAAGAKRGVSSHYNPI
jgi:ankyrin repeat protein